MPDTVFARVPAPAAARVALLLLALLLAVQAADPAPAAFDLRKDGTALRKDIDAVREVLTQALGTSPAEDKQKAVDRFTALKAEVQTFSDRALAAGKTEDEVGDLLERFQFTALSKMDRDLRAAINEGLKPKP